jgi:hypothetical protein
MKIAPVRYWLPNASKEKPMDENETQTTGGLTVIAIPADKVQEVLTFVESLETDEADVSGHMLSRGAIGGIGGGALGAKMTTTTGCQSTVTGKLGSDLTCYDTDTITTT